MIETNDLVGRLRKMAKCIYIAVEQTVADDISDGLTKAADRIAVLEGENATARAVIAEANNSLYGSQSYFVTTAGGGVAGAVGVTEGPDKYHLAKPIERLKGDSRAAWRAMRQLENGLSNDALDTLRAALKEGQ